MVTVKCKTEQSVLLKDIKPFQGELKKRSPKDIEALADSLSNDGLLMPFALWQTPEGTQYILDGHGRLQALMHLAVKGDATILEQQFPIVVIEASTEDEARKALLQITSTYGKFNNAGIRAFSSSISNYSAPLLKRTERKPYTPKVPEINRVMVRLSVDKAKLSQIISVLKQVDGVTVL